MIMKWVDPRDLVLHWEMNPHAKSGETLAALSTDMRVNRFDAIYPVTTFDFDDALHVADGHHRVEAAITAELRDVLVEVRTGGSEAHAQGFDTMPLGKAASQVWAMIPKRKKSFIAELLFDPDIWQMTDGYLARHFRTQVKTIATLRWRTGSDILMARTLNMRRPSEADREKLIALILRAERLDARGRWQPVHDCPLKAQWELIQSGGHLKIKIDPKWTVIENALRHGHPALEQITSMSPDDARQLRRDFLRAVHPDKEDLSHLSPEQRSNWHCMMNGFHEILKKLEAQLTLEAELLTVKNGKTD